MKQLSILVLVSMGAILAMGSNCGPSDPGPCGELTCEFGQKTASDGTEFCECRETDACIEIAAPPHRDPVSGGCVAFPSVCDIPEGWSECGACSLPECGAIPNTPASVCADGTTAGPVCLRDFTGQCGWEVHDCPATFCGGFAGIQCPNDFECVDDPNDGCDPQNGGADCGGVCVPAAGETCGGTTCGTGLVCCNASCGICTTPDGVCIQVACEPTE